MKIKTPSHLKRPRPAYLVYATDLIADETYAAASAAERGLLLTLLNHCWANGSVPADPCLMAKIVRLSEAETQAVSSALIATHFRPRESDTSRLFCPELDRQRAEYEECNRKQIAGGKKGGTKTQANNRESRQASSLPSSQASSLARAPEKRRDEKRREELSRKDDSPPTPDQQEWVDKYSTEQQAEAYRRATRGH